MYIANVSTCDVIRTQYYSNRLELLAGLELGSLHLFRCYSEWQNILETFQLMGSISGMLDSMNFVKAFQ